MKRWVLAAFVVMVINLYGGNAKVNLHLKDGSVFSCNKILAEKGSFLILEVDGKKMSLRKSLIESVDKVPENLISNKIIATEEKKQNQDAKSKKVYVIDDLNFVRTVFFDPYAKKEEKKLELQKDDIKIKMVSQKVERIGNKIKFDGQLQNQFGKNVESLKMIVSALDINGKVVVENTSQVSPKLANEQKVPFSFIFSDDKGEIVRFTYRFEGIAKEQDNKQE